MRLTSSLCLCSGNIYFCFMLRDSSGYHCLFYPGYLAILVSRILGYPCIQDTWLSLYTEYLAILLSRILGNPCIQDTWLSLYPGYLAILVSRILGYPCIQDTWQSLYPGC